MVFDKNNFPPFAEPIEDNKPKIIFKPNIVKSFLVKNKKSNTQNPKFEKHSQRMRAIYKHPNWSNIIKKNISVKNIDDITIIEEFVDQSISIKMQKYIRNNYKKYKNLPKQYVLHACENKTNNSYVFKEKIISKETAMFLYSIGIKLYFIDKSIKRKP